jgi:hypothetical protein
VDCAMIGNALRREVRKAIMHAVFRLWSLKGRNHFGGVGLM